MKQRALTYCKIYKLPEEVASILQHLHQSLWYMFHRNNVKDGQICVAPGYYQGYGAQTKKVDMEDFILKACVLAGTPFKIVNNSKRKGILHKRIIITFDANMCNTPEPMHINGSILNNK